MTRYQKLSLLVGALILVAVIALVAVVVIRPSSMPAPVISAGDMTSTWTFTYLATNAATVSALQTGIPLTLTALAPQ